MRQKSVFSLVIGAIGVVYGDIGTSPLYALKETFAGHHPVPLDRPHVLGVLSLVFWALTLVVSVKYIVFVMRADNRGEGGSLALLALLSKHLSDRPKTSMVVTLLGIFASALFYGDSMITPAISVLSAVEGMEVAVPHLEPYVVPITVAILCGLFLIQRMGTEVMGKLFGPITVVWFFILGWLGIRAIAHAPQVLLAISPHYAVMFMIDQGATGLLIFGAVVLAFTGAEALYADMGHFGKVPIRLAWYLLVMPGLVLNYFGQGALLLSDPANIDNPFFRLAPAWGTIPLVVLATLATIIASQAVISGAFSLTRQAIQLGYLPRMRIVHTSEHEIGQIYIPFVNWALMVAVVVLVIGFGSSSALAAAYGVAVTGNMLITLCLLAVVARLIWGWSMRKVWIMVGVFGTMDLVFFLTNAVKIPDGGWFPLATALALFTILTTWKRGRDLLALALRRDTIDAETFFGASSDRVAKVPGTAVFLTGDGDGVPLALMHNLKHNKVLHERVILLTVVVEEVPLISQEERLKGWDIKPGVRRLQLRYGFMEDPNIPSALAKAREVDLGFFYEPMNISYFLSRETIIPGDRKSVV